MHNIFITGGTGLVGSYIVKELLLHGYKPHVLARDPGALGLVEPLASQINIVKGNVIDAALLAEEIPKYDLVIHAAAIVSYAPNRFDEMYQINVEGTRNVVNECIASNKRLIHISSVAAIGSNDKSVVDEDGKWNDSDIKTYYAKTKYLSELEVWRAIEEGLRATIFNPSVVLGAGDMEKSSTKLFSYVKNKGKYYSAGNINYVDVTDVAKIVVSSISTENQNGKRYILNAGHISFKDFFEKIAALLQVPAPSTQVNWFTAGLAWRLAYFKYLLTGKEPLITKETAKLSQSSKVYDNTAVLKDFNFTFKSLDETLLWCCEKNK